jgi:hypothetical protein
MLWRASASIFFRLVGELFSGACPPESNQRGRHPAITACASLALLNKISRSRNSTWQLTNPVSYCGIRTVAPSSLILSPLLSVMEWDLSRQTRRVEIWKVRKPDSFITITCRCAHLVFGVPICRAEQRRVDGSLRPSAVRVPQWLAFCASRQGEFRWTPAKPSSTG